MIVPHEHAYSYLLGGKCTTTFHNVETNNQCTYYIRKPRFKPYWSVYTGGEYIGFIRGDVFVANGELPAEFPIQKIKIFNFVWRHLIAGDLLPNIHILHDGTCGRCGKQLTDAESIKKGLGPVCRKLLGL